MNARVEFDDRTTVRPYLMGYLEVLGLMERLHRLMLDVVKDEFERTRVIDINPVQAMVLFNVGDHEITAGELKSRGYYQGSNVSYNLKKLVELGYMHHKRCEIDRRSVRVRLTPKGHEIRRQVAALFDGHAADLEARTVIDISRLDEVTTALKRLERFWTDRIRYIY